MKENKRKTLRFLYGKGLGRRYSYDSGEAIYKSMSVFKVTVKKNGVRILPNQCLTKKKNNVFLMCGLVNGHSVGINLREGLITF